MRKILKIDVLLTLLTIVEQMVWFNETNETAELIASVILVSLIQIILPLLLTLFCRLFTNNTMLLSKIFIVLSVLGFFINHHYILKRIFIVFMAWTEALG